MAYQKVGWSLETNERAPAINGQNLEKVENGIVAVENTISNLTDYVNSQKQLSDPIGKIDTFGYELDANAKEKYLLCDSDIVPINKYNKLFNKIKYNYGKSFGESNLNQIYSGYGAAIGYDLIYSIEKNIFISPATNGKYVSNNGVLWDLFPLPKPYVAANVWSSKHNMFIGIVNKSFLTSPDGDIWTVRQNISDSTMSSLNSICYSETKNMFIAVGTEQPSGSSAYYVRFYISLDGITWAMVQKETLASQLHHVIWCEEKGMFVAVGNSMTYSDGYHSNLLVYTSTDGYNWTMRQNNTALPYEQLRKVCWSKEKNMFVAVGYEEKVTETPGYPYSPAIYISSDGYTWTLSYTEDKYMFANDIIFIKEKNIFIATLYNQRWQSGTSGPDRGKILSSQNGIDWNMIAYIEGSNLMQSIWLPDKEMCLVVGNDGMYVLTFDNGFKLPDYNNITPFTYIKYEE